LNAKRFLELILPVLKNFARWDCWCDDKALPLTIPQTLRQFVATTAAQYPVDFCWATGSETV